MFIMSEEEYSKIMSNLINYCEDCPYNPYNQDEYTDWEDIEFECWQCDLEKIFILLDKHVEIERISDLPDYDGSDLPF